MTSTAPPGPSASYDPRPVRSAVVYEKPSSVVRCEYVWRRTDRWIDFCWSTPGPVTPSR